MDEIAGLPEAALKVAAHSNNDSMPSAIQLFLDEIADLPVAVLKVAAHSNNNSMPFCIFFQQHGEGHKHCIRLDTVSFNQTLRAAALRIHQ